MDTINNERRSWNMSRIQGKNTKPEMQIRSLLHQMGYRFRLHAKGLSGIPDIVLPKYKTAIFVHGCFWHRHKGCKYAYIPKSRQEFWQEKFRKNVENDNKVLKELKLSGWRTLIIWECDLLDLEKVKRILIDTLDAKS